MRRAALLTLLVGVAACGDIPQPFRHDDEVPRLARPKLTRGVTVRPLDDSAEGRALADALVRALEDQEIPAMVRDGAAFGHVVDGRMQDGGKSVAVRWSLKAPDGAETAVAMQSVPKALLAQRDPVLMKRNAAVAAASLAAPLADPDATGNATAARSAGDTRSVVGLAPLRGLPGDGDKALTEAMRRALGRAGVLVRDDGAEYLLEGKVTVAPGLPGEDTVTVAWTVRRAGGGELGNIGQSGAVPRGRLAQSWGTLARDIAEGGASGVVEVVRADSRNGRRPPP